MTVAKNAQTNPVGELRGISIGLVVARSLALSACLARDFIAQ